MICTKMKPYSGFIDLHVHIGQWEETYYEPEEICSQLLDEEKLSVVGISSTSACCDIYDQDTLIQEVRPLFTSWPQNIFHWFWVHPQIIPKNLDFASGIPVHGLKIHPYSHDWHSDPQNLHDAFTLAETYQLPVLLHTGGKTEAEPLYFLPILQAFPRVTVILAHARPMEQALQVAWLCSNIFFDTAFVPAEDIAEAFKAGYAERFIFGTDYPINGPYRGHSYPEVCSNFPHEWHTIFQQNTRQFLNKTVWLRL